MINDLLRSIDKIYIAYGAVERREYIIEEGTTCPACGSRNTTSNEELKKSWKIPKKFLTKIM